MSDVDAPLDLNFRYFSHNVTVGTSSTISVFFLQRSKSLSSEESNLVCPAGRRVFAQAFLKPICLRAAGLVINV